MTPQTQTICKQEAKLFRDGKMPVYLLTDGRFGTFWGGKWVVKPTMKAIDRLISKERKSVKVFLVYNDMSRTYYSRDVTVVEACGTSGDKYLLKPDGGKVYLNYSQRIYAHDTERIAKLEDLARRVKEAEDSFYKEYEAIMKGAKQVGMEDIERLNK